MIKHVLADKIIEIAVHQGAFVDDLLYLNASLLKGARCSSVVKAFAHGAMGRWVESSRWTHCAPRLV